MAKKYEEGDVHAPIEDTDVALGLKVLVLIMLVALLGIAVSLAVALEGAGPILPH
jgi:hypothetical protein